MSGVNKCIIIGNLGRDPEVNFTKSGTAVCNLNLAVSERVKTDGEWTEHTEWVSVVVWGKQAESCGQHLAKGRSVYVEGRLQTKKYTGKDGVEKYRTEVVASTVQFLGGGEAKPGTSRRETGNLVPENREPPGGTGFIDDSELPF